MNARVFQGLMNPPTVREGQRAGLRRHVDPPRASRTPPAEGIKKKMVFRVPLLGRGGPAADRGGSAPVWASARDFDFWRERQGLEKYAPDFSKAWTKHPTVFPTRGKTARALDFAACQEILSAT